MKSNNTIHKFVLITQFITLTDTVNIATCYYRKTRF